MYYDVDRVSSHTIFILKEAVRFQYIQTPTINYWDHSLVSLTYLVDEHSALPAPIAWKYLILNFPPSAAELFRLPPHRSGTRHSRFGINTAVIPAPSENFFISTILYLLAL